MRILLVVEVFSQPMLCSAGLPKLITGRHVIKRNWEALIFRQAFINAEIVCKDSMLSTFVNQWS
ncbi:hypothetical protein SynPROSU1_00075 [Synechococcus sp. PROS-U-1]|nr:hypothetical protein SynPROSU1_00075 [Synechococcus sp. PROS-U-1]